MDFEELVCYSQRVILLLLLLGYAINSVVDSKDPDVQRFSENYNFEKIETAKGSDEIILEKGYNAEKILTGYTKTDLQTLNTKARRFGFDSLSSKEVERLLVHLGETSTLSEGAQTQVNLANNVDMFKRAGISNELIREWLKEEIEKQKANQVK